MTLRVQDKIIVSEEEEKNIQILLNLKLNLVLENSLTSRDIVKYDV